MNKETNPNGYEAVVSELSHYRDSEHVRKLIAYIQGGITADSLSWEDYATPMKLSGGEVCLRLEDDVGPMYVSYQKDGTLSAFVMDWNGNPLPKSPESISPFEVNQQVQSDRWDVSIVLEPDTPFVEQE